MNTRFRFNLNTMNYTLTWAFIAFVSLFIFEGCDFSGSGTGPVAKPPVQCADPSVVVLGRPAPTSHNHPLQIAGQKISLPAIQWTPADSVKKYFGGRSIKIVFTLDREMYLVEYNFSGPSSSNEPLVTKLSHGDEGIYGGPGSINSPLFSPDGKRIVYAGASTGKPAFIQDDISGDSLRLRIPLDPFHTHITADPHWYIDGDKTYIYYADQAGLVQYSEPCKIISGSTYRKQVLNDTLGPIEPTGIAGAYRGGISKDGIWAGTSYATSALFNSQDKITTTLAYPSQQCNPSINPYPIGSAHSDYMMILGFGGDENVLRLIDGRIITEGIHENLWIYNRNDKVVWKAAVPDTAIYSNWDKPEWSTDPDFATSVAILKKGNGTILTGDLYIVQIGDLANSNADTLALSQGYFKIGTGGFNSEVYSHLWVEPVNPNIPRILNK